MKATNSEKFCSQWIKGPNVVTNSWIWDCRKRKKGQTGSRWSESGILKMEIWKITVKEWRKRSLEVRKLRYSEARMMTFHLIQLKMQKPLW